ncbi:peptidoglycan editing factor PgeF [Macrococcus armenti]|uniref:peptidoglycan editing factor PgeF n=1 Tax=Macrococcus armenti TaxID=2875764 RepID=UPI001CC9DD9F|nr:peptidoglycan editing factor PgeF [Macrococcus armenti]UBH09453.1 peptidoglycan editing factor PgeF [Macrococcus armenti]UBH11746.1 peptidoglycan editing factor PgeF [Macrococcus armenti]
MDIFKRKVNTFNYRDDEYIIGITSRNGGVSAYPEASLNMARYIDDLSENVTENQKRVAAEIDMDTSTWIFPIQTHGNNIEYVSKKDRGTNISQLNEGLNDCDGLYTYDKEVLLTMCFADCVPVYVYSEVDDFIALGHAGWRGTVGLITDKLIRAYEGSPHHLHVVIGPSISGAAYYVNEDIKQQFLNLNLNLEDCFTAVEDENEIELKEINKRIALNCGVLENHIHISNYCTAQSIENFFSYRTEKGKTGRMLAYIGKRENNGR